MIIHMKPGAKKHVPLFQPRGPAMVYILWELLGRATRPLYHGKHDAVPLTKLAENKMACQLYGNPKANKTSTYVYTQSIMNI